MGATTSTDARATYSNYGTCLDLFAPGSAVRSLSYSNASSSVMMSGTSMAAPVVAGAAALVWGETPGIPARQVEANVLAQSRTGIVSSAGTGSPNRLASSPAAPPATSAPAPTAADGSTAVYRFWSDQNQTHFYTRSVEERDHVIAAYPDRVWRYEGVAFSAFSAPATGTVPVFRFWSTSRGAHFYTASEQERDHIITSYPRRVWAYEGVAFHAYPTARAGAVAVSRFWSPANSSHFYTANAQEAQSVRSSYPARIWTFEGIRLYVPAAPATPAPLP